MLAGAAAELFTIGAVLPFLALLAEPTGTNLPPVATGLLAKVGWIGGDSAVLSAALLLSTAAVLAAALRLILTWVTHAFVFRFGHEVGVRIYARLLRQPYLYHVQRNSSEALASVEKVQNALVGVLLPLMQGTVAAILATFIIALLVVVAPGPAAVTAFGVIAVYVSIGAATRKSLRKTSKDLAGAVTQRIRQVQEGLGGIRDILLDRSQAVFERGFADADDRLRRGQMKTNFFAVIPRVVIETGGIIVIAIIALSMSRQPGGLVAALPVLGALAIGAQRLLPLLQSIYLSVTRVAGSTHIIAELVRAAEAPLPPGPHVSTAPGHFQQSIAVRSLSFEYPGASIPSVSGIDLVIKAGERVGFFGETGSGKSTLLDLLMGLLPPTTGEILIDGIPLDDASRAAWQARIAHVPQFIYLADGSIASNIAFGADQHLIDLERVRLVAEQAQVAEFIESLPDRYQTRVGERGVRLSGGQRQRLGLARALYKSPSVLVLDEATSALDDETEAAVMAALDSDTPARTLIIVAHRLSTLANCDRLIRMRNGRIEAEGPYQDLIGSRQRAPS